MENSQHEQKQPERQRVVRRGTSLQEMYEKILEHKKNRSVDEYDELDYNDDDADCFCD